MTQTQLVKTLAESCELSNRVARQFLENLAIGLGDGSCITYQQALWMER